MSRTSTKMFIFAAGAAIGSAVAWMYAKKYYERIANDEIESMKEWVARRVKEQDEKTSDTNVTKRDVNLIIEKPDLMEYAAKVKDLKYYDYSKKNEPTNEEKEEVELDLDDRIYVIKPEAFGEEDGYEEVSLTYYSDGVLTDEQDNPIEDVESMVRADFADYFGVYEDDSVFVRNELLRTDFEILADQRKYSDLAKNSPYPMEDE